MHKQAIISKWLTSSRWNVKETLSQQFVGSNYSFRHWKLCFLWKGKKKNGNCSCRSVFSHPDGMLKNGFTRTVITFKSAMVITYRLKEIWYLQHLLLTSTHTAKEYKKSTRSTKLWLGPLSLLLHLFSHIHNDWLNNLTRVSPVVNRTISNELLISHLKLQYSVCLY